MKRPIVFLLLALVITLTSKTMAQSEFSSNLISVGSVVTDIEKSLDFYINVIGMKKANEFDIDEEFSKISGLAGGVPFHVDVLKLEDSPEANNWKLISFGTEAAHPMPKYIQDDTGMQYITIRVKSLEPFLKRIKKHNIKLLGDTPVPLDAEQHFVLIQDPDGTIIELIGPLK